MGKNLNPRFNTKKDKAMPTRLVTDPEEWYRLTGERGHWIIELGPAKKPRPSQKTDKPKPDPLQYQSFIWPAPDQEPE
jgi:hypothetical protein